MNNNDDDFTFCKVESPVDLDGSETKKLTTKMDEITIKSKPSTSDHQINGSLWKVGLSNTSTSMTKKQDTVGSLSFNVIDAASSPKQSIPQRPKQRAKVPFEKGYSQVDWLRLTQTHPDLADLKGELNKRLIPMSEVRLHKSEGSSWTVLKGRVYNLTPYMKFHPGGVDMLKKAVGKDCTALFNKYHAWVNAEFLMEKCLVGVLDDSQAQK